MAKGNILVVDDEQNLLQLVKYNLTKEGYSVTAVATGEDALAEAGSRHPDLILLDLMLPGIDGLEVCRLIKNNPAMSGIPVVMLTARGEDADVVTGLELGADDYIIKPFSPRVLVARVRALLRRKTTPPDQTDQTLVRLHDILIDPGKHQVYVEDQPVELTFTEFKLLQLLIQRPGWVFTRYQIVDALRGEDYPVSERSVDVQIVSLRKKLGNKGDFIQTVRGMGYKFKE
jgi:two-component system phosphate regulon response regulator PhoB